MTNNEGGVGVEKKLACAGQPESIHFHGLQGESVIFGHVHSLIQHG